MADSRLDEDLLNAYSAGDDAAGEQLFARYYDRLIRLVRQRMGWRLTRVEGSSDIAQAVLHSVLRRSRSSAPLHADAEGSLWPLLVTVAVNKVHNLHQFWQRERRDQRREVALEETIAPTPSGPTPEEVASVQDLIERMLAAFPERRKRILELMLEGRATNEIADLVSVSERTVYNTRQAAAEMLRRLLSDE